MYDSWNIVNILPAKNSPTNFGCVSIRDSKPSKTIKYLVLQLGGFRVFHFSLLSYTDHKL